MYGSQFILIHLKIFMKHILDTPLPNPEGKKLAMIVGMEELEKNLISQKLPYLCKHTTNQLELCTALWSQGILAESGKNEIISNLFDQNKKIYEVLITKTEKMCWPLLLQILGSTGNEKMVSFLTEQLEEIKSKRVENLGGEGAHSTSGEKIDHRRPSRREVEIELALKSVTKMYTNDMKNFIQKSTKSVHQITRYHHEMREKFEKKVEENLDALGVHPVDSYLDIFVESVATEFANLMKQLRTQFLAERVEAGESKNGNHLTILAPSKEDPLQCSKDWRVGKSYAQKRAYYLATYPSDCNDENDFVVSLAWNQQVRSSKMRLIIASPVLEKLFVGAGFYAQKSLSLPQYSANVFRAFINSLPPVDENTLKDFTKLFDVSISDILQVVVIRKKFGVNDPPNVLDLFLENRFGTIQKFLQKEEFLKLPHQCLEQLLSSDFLPVDELSLWERVLKWAEYNCEQNGRKPTGKNMRNRLGPALSQVRFPLLPFPTFFQFVMTKEILTDGQVLDLMEIFHLPDELKNDFKFSTLPAFKTQPRSLKFKTEAEVVTFCSEEDGIDQDGDKYKPFLCHGQQSNLGIQLGNRVALHGIGFLGPIKSDALYHITINIEKYQSGNYTPVMKMARNIYAKKKKTFFVDFDEPLIFGPFNPHTYENECRILYSLLGPDTYRNPAEHNNCLQFKGGSGNSGGTHFKCYFYEPQACAGLKFRKLS